jgi:non-heme chloroperoxidase
LQTAVRGLQDPVPVQFARELQGAAAHVPLPEPVFNGLIAESLKLPARVWKSTLDGLFAFDDAADLGRIAAPTLLIWGEWDRWLPQEEEDQLVAAIPGARVVVYPATGHSPNWGRHGRHHGASLRFDPGYSGEREAVQPLLAHDGLLAVDSPELQREECWPS